MKKSNVIIIVLIAILLLIGVIYSLSVIQKETDSNTNNSDVTSETKNNKNDYFVTYTEENYNLSNKNNELVIENTRNILSITSKSNSEAAKSIENFMNSRSDTEWNENIKTTSDSIKNSEEIDSLKPNDEILGATLTISDIALNKKYSSFELSVGGGFGGVSWTSLKAYSFDQNGKLLSLDDITDNETELINYIIKDIKSSYDIEGMEENWEEEVKKIILDEGHIALTDKGLLYVFDKYEIADGATNIVSNVIEYSKINEYLKDTYQG